MKNAENYSQTARIYSNKYQVYAEIIENLSGRLEWYVNRDPDTGEILDRSLWSQSDRDMAAAIETVMDEIAKMANINK